MIESGMASAWAWNVTSQLVFDPARAMATIMGVRAPIAGLRLAQGILEYYGATSELGSLSTEDLRRVPGIGPIRAKRLLAAFELGRWRHGKEPRPQPPVSMSRLRGQVPPTETMVLALRPESTDPPITLSVGRGLTKHSPLGGFVAQLLMEARSGWWLMVFRPSGAPTEEERNAAKKFVETAHLVDLHIDGVFVFGRAEYWAFTAGGLRSKPAEKPSPA